MEKRFDQICEDKDHLDKIGMYKYFILIHSLVTGTYQDIFNEKDEINIEEEQRALSMNSSETAKQSEDRLLQSLKAVATKTSKTGTNRDISVRHFDMLYRNKIKAELEKKSQMQFHEINLLLEAYESWRYEKASKKTLD